MDCVLARKKSASSVGSRSRKRSQPGSASSVTPSDQKPREEKSARYRDVRYIEELQDQKSYMMDSEQGISDESKKQIVMLLNSDQEPPQDSSFSDTLFSRTCQSVVDRNEARINRDITPELVPSAEKLAHRGARKLGCLIEMKCGFTSLEEADRQNAHTATLAVRGVVELFMVLKREHEIDRKILAFSVSQDHRQVRLYGHYADFKEGDAKYYRHTIRTFDFTELDGKEKFTSYRFIKNIYEIWMPQHFSMLCSAIDQLPGYSNPDVTSLRESALSHHLETYSLSQSQSQSEIESAHESQQDATPNTSFTGAGPVKKLRRRRVN
ncbi:hypothetical protein VB005_04320 [Metarhizium brunneum]